MRWMIIDNYSVNNDSTDKNIIKNDSVEKMRVSKTMVLMELLGDSRDVKYNPRLLMYARGAILQRPHPITRAHGSQVTCATSAALSSRQRRLQADLRYESITALPSPRPRLGYVPSLTLSPYAPLCL
jgi:hypothetical protein